MCLHQNVVWLYVIYKQVVWGSCSTYIDIYIYTYTKIYVSIQLGGLRPPQTPCILWGGGLRPPPQTPHLNFMRGKPLKLPTP